MSSGAGDGPEGARYADLIGLWQDGQARLRQLEPVDRAVAERVIGAILDELRRRLGGPFSTRELAELYLRDGTDWCFDVAVRTAPTHPEAWDLTTVAGAAFAHYARAANDYATGRRLTQAPEDR